MAFDLQSIARLVGMGAEAPGSVTQDRGFVTTVRRADEITPFETVIRAAEAQKISEPHAGTAAPEGQDVKARQAQKAQKSFEAFALQVFIGAMMPKENVQMFGTGSAGKLWQSLLAEKLAEQIAASGRLKLLPGHGSKVEGAASPQPADSANKINVVKG